MTPQEAAALVKSGMWIDCGAIVCQSDVFDGVLGQAASESDGHRHISGTGRQQQSERGAYASKGGNSFICLASTYDKRGEGPSRIATSLTQRKIVTTPRTDITYVVTEYGLVNLEGKSVPERAKALTSIAHPDFREGLEREA